MLYTLNDNLAGDVAATLTVAYEVYKEPRFIKALERLGDFLLLAQMPGSQPGWCQQYHFNMKPSWARKFEPPAIVTSESQDVMRALLAIYRATNKTKYLAPIPPALTYFESCLLPDGRLPRYLELQTNKPLYMERTGEVYTLTYSDKNLPSHYAFKIRPKLSEIRKEYERTRSGLDGALATSTEKLEKKARYALSKLDAQGRWVDAYQGKRLAGKPPIEPGDSIISSRTFAENVHVLCAYLEAMER